MTANKPIPELAQVRLGYIPLTDAAPLIIALEHGHFAR
ncbi:ABC transporter substrate-binding protein, partial [Immundisolibacter sp.]